jgi:polyisoprenoid-binding protein YceI
MKKAAFSALALCLAAVPALAQTWSFDAAHSTIGFSVRHMMVSNVRGSFGKAAVTLEGDPASPATAKVGATIDVASIDTRDPRRDEHLKSPDFFDAAKFPTISFVGKSVEKTGPGKVKLGGELTMHGVTKPVVLDVSYTAPIKDVMGMTRIGVAATGTVNRRDFGVSWSKALDAGGAVVGDDVTIQLELEFTQKPPAK